MKLLTTNENLETEISSELLEIEDFKILVKRVKVGREDNDGRRKLIARKELAYVYHMSNPLSRYYNYSEDERKKKLKEDLFKEVDPTWEPDEVVAKAIAKYQELTKTPSLHSVESMLNSLHECTDIVNAMTKQIKENLIEEKYKAGINNKKGEVITGVEIMLGDLTALLKVSKEIPNHIEVLEKLFEKLKAERSKAASKIRGGAQISERER